VRFFDMISQDCSDLKTSVKILPANFGAIFDEANNMSTCKQLLVALSVSSKVLQNLV